MTVEQTSAVANGSGIPLTRADLERTIRDLKAIPKGKWFLFAPDGRVWADESVQSIARTAALEALRDESPFPLSIVPGA